MGKEFQRISAVVQDSCYEVRNGFLTKLMKMLRAKELAPKWGLVVFLVAHDPDQENIDAVSSALDLP